MKAQWQFVLDQFWRGTLLRYALTGLILIVVSATQLGCQSSIEVVTPAVTSVPPAVTAVPQAHAIAIIGVDFDPALNYSQIIANGGVTLLVAVENQGLATEMNVELKVRLLDAVDEAKLAGVAERHRAYPVVTAA